jgi:putative DNA primase/helicase
VNLLEAALAWYDAGASVLPCGAGKHPARPWKDHQTERLDADDLTALLSGDEYDGIGIVTGFNGFEMFELEGRAADLLLPLLMKLSAELSAKVTRYMERTPSGGWHCVYICQGEQEGSTRLARTADGQVAIETRSRFGWTVVAPSGGNVHEKIPGGRWEVAEGCTPGQVAVLTEQERAELFDAARELDEMPPPPVVEHRPTRELTGGDLAPGQDFEQRADWMFDILGPAGWTVHSHQGEKTFLTRPGKRFGKSATLNYDGNDNLYVFTSSTDFPPESSWTKFGAYAFLHHDGDYSAAAKALRRQGYGTAHPTGKEESERTLRLILGDGAAPTNGTAALHIAEETSSHRPASLTDDGNAALLVAIESPRLRYSPAKKEWSQWGGQRWEWHPDDSPAIHAMRQIAQALDASDDALLKHKIRSLSWNAMDRAVKIARRDPAMQVRVEDLDANGLVLNTPGGQWDAHSEGLTPPSPDQWHTRITAVTPDFKAVPERWLRFLGESLPQELIPYAQELLGYSCLGVVLDHILPFLYGLGGNGKTVFLEVSSRLLGDYASPAPLDFLLRGGREDESAVAGLSGLRMVVCSEVAQDARFNEPKVKLLTGGDKIRARFLYGKHFTFSPTHHLWLAGNHKPEVAAGGDSFFRRFRILPFTRVPRVRDEKLIDRLVDEEGPAILAWMLVGAQRVLAQGISTPQAVLDETAEYAREEDHIGLFIADRLRLGGGEHVKTNSTVVRAAYEHFCSAEGYKPLAANIWGREMKARGLLSKPSNGKRWFVGVAVLGEGSSVTDPEPRQLAWQ